MYQNHRPSGPAVTGFEQVEFTPDIDANFDWLATPRAAYHSVLKRIPDLFSWDDQPTLFWRLLALRRSVNTQRFMGCLDLISKKDSVLAASMRETFLSLPSEGKVRFVEAPETFNNISCMRKTPVSSIMSLCNSLNAEAVSYEERAAGLGKRYWTALGDFYFADEVRDHLCASKVETIGWNPDRSFISPQLASNITIDFFSPAYDSSKVNNFPAEYLQYSNDERGVVYDRLVTAFDRIADVSYVAARILKEFVKVIIPHKVKEGSGSTSQTSVPGRVLLRGCENASLEWLMSALIHESIHQVLYILEFADTFVIGDVDGKSSEARVASLWTGRELGVHSFFHACFVWYGLSHFWSRALGCGDLDVDRAAIANELKKCTSGFQRGNPVAALGSHSELIRYDALCIARTLHGRVEPIFKQLAGVV